MQYVISVDKTVSCTFEVVESLSAVEVGVQLSRDADERGKRLILLMSNCQPLSNVSVKATAELHINHYTHMNSLKYSSVGEIPEQSSSK